jgi:hypothetical protein
MDRTPKPNPSQVARAAADVDAEAAERGVKLTAHERTVLIEERAHKLAAADNDTPKHR